MIFRNPAKLADRQAPEGCGAGIRVALAPIKDGSSKDESVSKKGLSDGLGCPKGFFYVDGACTSTAAGKATLCSEGDEPGCQKQCSDGSRASCDRYARVLLYRDDEGKELDAVLGKINAVKARFEEACASDQPATCTALGVAAFSPLLKSGDASDKPKLKRGVEYMAAGCRAGDFVACSFVRMMAGERGMGTEVGVNGEKLLKDTLSKGCAGGGAVPCGFQAFEHATGQVSIKQDASRALEFSEQACLGSFAEGCLLHAGLLASKERCEQAWQGADSRLQHIYRADEICALADQVPDDAAKAKKSLARACELGAKTACK
jgi:TPR repeat protein